MVVLRVVGGLGNQLHIAAFGKALEALGNEVAFDLSYYDQDESRAFALDRLNMPIKLARPVGPVYQEPDLLFHPEFLKKYDHDCTLHGYWQCAKYWQGLESEIRSGLALRRRPDEKNLAVAKKIQESQNSTFLHVRRSDNLSVRGMAFHNISPFAYYEKAIQLVTEQTGTPSLFVFSDDIEWCKQSMPFPATYVDLNNPGVDWDAEYNLKRNSRGGEHLDFWLMSLCKNSITGTSTFSWWAAWANQNPKKVCISPDQWFVGEQNQYSRDMIPWSRI